MNIMNNQSLNRRDLLGVASAGLMVGSLGCEEAPQPIVRQSADSQNQSYAHEEYVWIAALANLPLFTNRDHPALRMAGKELGVQVTIVGPNTIDIPALVAAIEQTAARKPAGIMVVGFDPSALVAPINRAMEAGIPVICVDADVPASNRITFIGTDWFDLGVRQAKGMLAGLQGRKGTVALLGMVELTIMQDAFAGFRSVLEPAGLTLLPPQQDKANQVEAARVTASIIQAHPKLVGVAGFDSQSGPGIGQAIKEARKAGQIIATSVDDQEQHLRLVKEGVLHTCVGQKRELFTYLGLQALFAINHSPVKFTSNDQAAGIYPVPVVYNTGAYNITKENVDLFLNSDS